MKRSSLPVQTDLFSGGPAPPVVTSLQAQHDELVELLSKLLWEVVQATHASTLEEASGEQDQH